MEPWATVEQVDVLLGERADSFSPEQKTEAINLATLTLSSAVICPVALDENGLPVDGRFQLATAVLASELLTAAPAVGGAAVESETLGGYRYQLSEAPGTSSSLLDLTGNPTILGLIGFCLPATNYTLDTSQDYPWCGCPCGGLGGAGCNCAYSAHGYGCPCPTPLRDTHYPYPARRFP